MSERIQAAEERGAQTHGDNRGTVGSSRRLITRDSTTVRTVCVMGIKPVHVALERCRWAMLVAITPSPTCVPP